jgi:hypothetical protein
VAKQQPFPVVEHDADFCVVGGGMAGLCAAIAAARRGAKTVLLHERPVLGGNASSEVRIHVCGADRHNHIKNLRETGILEELRLENLRRNPNGSFSIWDTILYEKAKAEPNLTLLLNCTCVGADMARGEGILPSVASSVVSSSSEEQTAEGNTTEQTKEETDAGGTPAGRKGKMPSPRRIAAVRGWQLTTQTVHLVRAKLFADCSGDAVLAPLTGAEFRVGREARGELGESLAPEQADRKTMGMTCCFGARELAGPQSFEPPAWALRFDRCEDLPFGEADHHWYRQGYWWMELGGTSDTIADTERLRDELLKLAYGVWDHVKNRCRHKHEAANWALDWVQFLPGKRESRRYVGDHMLSQCDLEAEGRFDDLVAYGGWTMDDHNPEGFWSVRSGAPATHWHRSPSPYGIPLRSLYSRNVANLFFAGRCASATHMAMSSTRVMGTGCSMGQAVGTAAAMATRLGCDPRGLLPRAADIQQWLLRDDCYLPWIQWEPPSITLSATLAASQGDPEPLRDGEHRPVGSDGHCWLHRTGDHVEYLFDKPKRVRQATLVLDSGLELEIQMSHFHDNGQVKGPPPPLPRAFRVEVLSAGKWGVLHHVTDNHQRLIRLPIGKTVEGVRYVLEATHGREESKLFAFYVE